MPNEVPVTAAITASATEPLITCWPARMATMTKLAIVTTAWVS